MLFESETVAARNYKKPIPKPNRAPGDYLLRPVQLRNRLLLMIVVAAVIDLLKLTWQSHAIENDLMKTYGKEYSIWRSVALDGMPIQDVMAANKTSTGRHLDSTTYESLIKGDQKKQQDAQLFQKMYDQHGMPAIVTRLIGFFVNIALVALVLIGYENQLRKFERGAELAGIIKMDERIEMAPLI